VAKNVKEVRLFFQEGSSDKVYNAFIVENAGSPATYDVLVEWGRRGASLNYGKKANNVTLAQATKEYDKLVREKTNKGYQELTATVKPAAVAPPVGQGSGSLAPSAARKIVGPKAQLLNPIDDGTVEQFIIDDDWIAQQKLDGKRVIAMVESDGVIALNRNGQETTADASLMDGVSMLENGTVVDGEIVGDTYWLFDVLKAGARDVTSLSYAKRHALLSEELEPGLSGNVRVLPVVAGAKNKRDLIARMTAQNAEGVVFKDKRAPYAPGRPSSGGTQRKHKLIKSADVAIMMNAGNAYLMCVYNGKKPVECGKVFAGTTNESRKEIDDLLAKGVMPVAEVQYLYATDDDKLFQPVFVRLRDDKKPFDCAHAQLVKTNREVEDT
jgi:bifunctional non-homologous end joining protein LigD